MGSIKVQPVVTNVYENGLELFLADSSRILSMYCVSGCSPFSSAGSSCVPATFRFRRRISRRANEICLRMDIFFDGNAASAQAALYF